MTASRDWFAVSRSGLALQVEGRPAAWVLYEVLANSLDAPGVRKVSITMEPLPGLPQARLTVTDDAPGGVQRLDDLWTLFAPSTSAPHAERRGRFCLGEKLLLAPAVEAEVVTTTGGVRFDADGRHRLRQRREAGTVLTATLRLTREQTAEIHAAASLLLPPAAVEVWYNGTRLLAPAPVATTQHKLQTEITDEAGVLRRRVRETDIAIYEPGERGAWLYELGIPVVPTGDRYSYDIQQKVPLNKDRDNVPPAYLTEVRAAVLNATYGLIDGDEEATEEWVRDAVPKADPEAAKAVFVERFGDRAVAYDPSDPEGSRIAMSKGYTVVSGGSMSSAEWDAARRAKVLPAAGQVTPSPKVLCSEDGVPPVDHHEWSPSMVDFAGRVAGLAHRLIGLRIKVEYYTDPTVGGGRAAWYGGAVLTFNLGRLGKAWCERPLLDEPVLSLIIHELAHQYAQNHLSEQYYGALADLGARCARVMKEHPEAFA